MIKEFEAKKRFYLEEEFRNVLFKKALEKEGSLRQIGKKMGYSGPSPNYYINRMWRGEQSITLFQLKVLSEITGVSLEKILQHASQIEKPKSRKFLW